VSSSTRYMRNVRKDVDPEVLAQLDISDGSKFNSDVENLEEDFVVQANKLEEEDGATSTRLPEIKQEHVHANQSLCVEDNNNAAPVDNAL
jgi:protein LTV1